MSGETGVSRRKFLGVVTTGATIGLAGCSASSGGGTSTPSHDETTIKSSSLRSQLETIRSATAEFTDPKAALKNGFKPGGPYVPGMGWHFQNPKWLKSAAKNGFDLKKPPILTYVATDDGLKLGSAEYGAPAKAAPKSPDLFDDESAEATEKWETHGAATHVFAKPDGSQTKPKDVTFEEWTTRDHWAEFSPPDSDLKAGDTVSLNWGSAKGKQGERTERVADVVSTHPDLRALHVWAHQDNPDGVFAPINPRFTEGGGTDHH